MYTGSRDSGRHWQINRRHIGALNIMGDGPARRRLVISDSVGHSHGNKSGRRRSPGPFRPRPCARGDMGHKSMSRENLCRSGKDRGRGRHPAEHTVSSHARGVLGAHAYTSCQRKPRPNTFGLAGRRIGPVGSRAGCWIFGPSQAMADTRPEVSAFRGAMAAEERGSKPLISGITRFCTVPTERESRRNGFLFLVTSCLAASQESNSARFASAMSRC